ncbi:MAG: hypothetical protein QX189_15440 [Methylococcales bacterium]
MQKAYEDGLVIQTKAGGVPAMKRYLDEQEGAALDDNWLDIGNVQSKKKKLATPPKNPKPYFNVLLNVPAMKTTSF